MIKYLSLALVIWISQSTFAATFLESLQVKNQTVEQNLKQNNIKAAYAFMQSGRFLLSFGFDEDSSNQSYTRNFRNTGEPKKDRPTEEELAEIFKIYSLSAPTIVGYARQTITNPGTNFLENYSLLKRIINIIFELHTNAGQVSFYDHYKKTAGFKNMQKQRMLSIFMDFDSIFRTLYADNPNYSHETFSWGRFYALGQQLIAKKLHLEDNRAYKILKEIEPARALLSSLNPKKINLQLDKSKHSLSGFIVAEISDHDPFKVEYPFSESSIPPIISLNTWAKGTLSGFGHGISGTNIPRETDQTYYNHQDDQEPGRYFHTVLGLISLAQEASILTLQEVSTHQEPISNKTYAKLLEENFKKEQPDWNAVIDEKPTKKGFTNLILFDVKLFDLLPNPNDHLEQELKKLSGIVQRVVLKRKSGKNQQPFEIINVHLDGTAPEKREQHDKAKLALLKNICDLIQKPTLIIGDFNLDLRKWAYNNNYPASPIVNGSISFNNGGQQLETTDGSILVMPEKQKLATDKETTEPKINKLDYRNAMETGRNRNRFPADEIERITSLSNPEEELRVFLKEKKFHGTRQIKENGIKRQIPTIDEYIKVAIRGDLHKDVMKDFNDKKLSAFELLNLGNIPFKDQQYHKKSGF